MISPVVAFVSDIREFLHCLEALRNMKNWTWKNMQDLQAYVHPEHLVNLTDDSFVFGSSDNSKFQSFLYKSISAHIPKDARLTYKQHGLVKGVDDSDECPIFFRNEYCCAFDSFQSKCREKPAITCSCAKGNCKSCVCKRAGNDCTVWCHGGLGNENKNCCNSVYGRSSEKCKRLASSICLAAELD